MRRRWWLWLGLGALLVVLATAAAVVTLESIDWAAYQAPVANAVEEATGRRLTIQGPARVELSLRPTLRLQQVAFRNAEWGSRPDMARCDHVAVRLRLIPLLFGRVEVGRVELRNFGVFEVKHRKPRKARHPVTGETMDVPARNVVVFRPSAWVEERVADLPPAD